MKYGLIGKKLGHSWSQEYFTHKFAELGLTDHSYELFELPSVEGLKEWALREGLSGFNVTVPYKQEVIPQLDALDEVASAVGAVNCVTVENDRLIGHNTDAPAFRDTLSSLITHHSSPITQAFILGTGGAARAVAYALQQLAIPHTFVSRHPDQHPELQPNIIDYSQFSILNSQFSILTNATPVGMYPDTDRTPLELNNSKFSILNSQFVYDLIYNPSPTLFLRQAAGRGAIVKDGLEMLHRQADLSWDFWRNIK